MSGSAFCSASPPGLPSSHVTTRLGRTGDDGRLRLQVYAHHPSHVAAAVPWCLNRLRRSRARDEEADPGNGPSGHDSDCVVLFRIDWQPQLTCNCESPTARAQQRHAAARVEHSRTARRETAAQATAPSTRCPILASCVALICIRNRQYGSGTCPAGGRCGYWSPSAQSRHTLSLSLRACRVQAIGSACLPDRADPTVKSMILSL